jgi:hypothetical protein
MLRDILAKRNLRISDWSRREHLSQGYASNLCAGRRAPPLMRVDGWAARLGLDGDEAECFRCAAVLANIPRDVLPHLEHLLASEGQSRREIIAMISRRVDQPDAPLLVLAPLQS